MRSKRVLIFSRAYQNMAGGVEKMSLDLASGLADRGHKVTILSLDQESDNAFFDWPENVSWKKVGIGDPDKRATFVVRLRRILTIRSIVKELRPHVGLGFQVGSFALMRLATIGLGMQSIAAERNSPDLFNYISRGKVKRVFSSLILGTSTRAAVQFEAYKSKYPHWLRNKLVVTPNWVQMAPEVNSINRSSKFKILFVGRLTFQKNVEVLLNAMNHLPEIFELTIIGTGPELKRLRELAHQGGRNIFFKEPQLDLSRDYMSADILCMPSRWEGFPNVVAEALAHGLPVVGFSDCSGIPDLVTDGLTGVIAPGMNDSDSLKQALLRASDLQFDPKKIRESMRPYSFESFIDNWEKAIS
jgi:glycosyltransferase involved in cell wall biosynthesis